MNSITLKKIHLSFMQHEIQFLCKRVIYRFQHHYVKEIRDGECTLKTT